MTAWAAMVRAVNVGGARLAMADLRAIGTAAGFEAVRTHLNSGNLLFEASSGTPRQYAATVSAELERLVGRPVPVIVRTGEQLRRAADRARRLFPDAPEKTVAIAFLDRPVLDVAPDRLGTFDTERYVIDGDAVHLLYPAGQADSKLTLPMIEKRLGVVATARGVRSVEGMATLLGA
ncbi:DUF1697 domain-containing protein [Nakamurella deserti]|uniref:DUF1697 domain-containing protein n=1 Tax=Nakamurella deserti TaxID=2164074 RepID=UPI000DBE0495|nr:DUF1697 domain-containing protein [Nakamurella deserti]